MTTAARLYRKPISTFWWLRRRSYFVFVLRELSSVFVAWFVVYLLLLVDAVGSGSAEYHRFLSWSAIPWVLALNVIALLFVLLHAITWFNLAPKAIVVRLGSRRVPPVLILALHYLLWGLLSATVLWVVLR
jgi:fumarate reductase subunit C